MNMKKPTFILLGSFVLTFCVKQQASLPAENTV
ncbi:hypothetical protein Xenpb_01996 [Xenorhabdus sp. PB62.4]|nr:hypothetical protein [Xenorhabdus sp. PB62.4]